jgi:hypothetical protein
MSQKKDRELSDKELKKAAGGKGGAQSQTGSKKGGSASDTPEKKPYDRHSSPRSLDRGKN